jgi:hypothetical protein
MERKGYKSLSAVVVFALGLLLAQCAGSKPGTGYVDDTPDEIRKLVEHKYSQGLFAVGSASGSDENLAHNKAVMQARAEIARQFKSQIDVLQKSYEESLNGESNDDYNQAVEVFATLQLNGSKIVKSMLRKERSGEYAAKVLVVVSAEQVKALIDEKMQAYTSFKASEAYKELENRVSRERQLSADAGR